jgi:8-oxo-dGDP phosphatase
MQRQPDIRRLASTVVYETRYIRVREDSIQRADGSTGLYSYVDKPDFALIIAMEDGGFHLVQQYRYPTTRRSWEFPQGTMPDLADAVPEYLAREELRQETGITARTMRNLGRLHCAPGMANQGFNTFLATDLEHGQAEPDAEERDLIHQWVSQNDFAAMILAGVITDAPSIAAYSLLLLHGLTTLGSRPPDR